MSVHNIDGLFNHHINQCVSTATSSDEVNNSEKSRIIYTESCDDLITFEKEFYHLYLKQTYDDLLSIAYQAGFAGKFTLEIDYFMLLISRPDNIAYKK
ncbi:hypothetical protein ABK905_07235 [Acerihabitans sp. KWT182]|uniref:Uncharacterized protein n=1 Tax=Acerihabitans sp. KWT182 TaxID=3157919 RepID=A0AAU7QF99_9GAMM